MKLSLNIDGTGRGTVSIDGVPVESNIVGVEFRSRVGHVTQVQLSFGMIDVEGEIETEEISTRK